MDDLMSLNFNDGPPPAWGAAGSISLGRSNSPSGSSSHSSSSNLAMGGAPAGYNSSTNMFSMGGSGTDSPAFSNSPMLQAGTLRPSTPGYQPYSQGLNQQQQPAVADNSFGDFDFVSNTGAASGPTTGKRQDRHFDFMSCPEKLASIV